jgi:hypothetical protein
MDFVNKLTGGNKGNNQQQEGEYGRDNYGSNQQQGGFGGGNNQQQGSVPIDHNVEGGSGSNLQKSSGGFLGGITDKLNGAAGGGRESEKNEDYLDKGTLTSSCSYDYIANDRIGVDFVQEKFMGGGAQDNESAIEQAKDEQVSIARDCVVRTVTYLDNRSRITFVARTSRRPDLTCPSRTRRPASVRA